MRIDVLIATALFAVVGLSGCLEGGANDSDGTPLPPLAADAPLADYFHDLSERVLDLPTVTEQYRTSVPGPLGESSIELDTWIIRPLVEGPVPVVLEVTPYYGGGEPTSRGRVGAELIERGYAVGVSSVRGTGNSGGCFSQAGPQEAKDTAAVIEHLAGQPWSNGNVGLIGVSYPGTTPQDVWVEAPPSLKTIVPISGISDMYKYNFVNGVPINPQGPAFNTYYWVLVGPQFDPTDVETVPGAIAGELCPDQTDVQQGGASSGVDGNKDAYWQVRDFGAEYMADEREVERASVFYIHGLQDWNVKPHMMEDWLDLLWDSGVPMKVWLGQWVHAWPSPSGLEAQCKSTTFVGGYQGACRDDWWNQTLVAWFDQFLKEVDTGILDAPAVQVQDDDHRWRHEERWPPQDVTWQTLHFGEGTLSEAPGSGGQVSYMVTPTGHLLGTEQVQVGTRATFESAPLEEDMTLSGLIRLTGDVRASANRAYLIFSLGEADGDSVRWFNHGALSLNHAHGLEEGRQSIADEIISVDVNAFPQDDVVHAGNRLVVSFGGMTAGGAGPSLLPANDGGSITLFLETMKLELPVDTTLVYEAIQPYADWEEIADEA